MATWFELAKSAVRTLEFETSWGAFERAWERVRTPYGETMDDLKEAALAAALPAGVEVLGYGLPGRALVKLCKVLARHHAPAPFYLAARTAGDAIGVHFTEAAAMLRALRADGVIELAEQGSLGKRRASAYHFTWEPP